MIDYILKKNFKKKRTRKIKQKKGLKIAGTSFSEKKSCQFFISSVAMKLARNILSGEENKIFESVFTLQSNIVLGDSFANVTLISSGSIYFLND